tara:strand:- start:2251 stop:4098 length:1848 start_codon:yes stop_codon:yes gene_type:complete
MKVFLFLITYLISIQIVAQGNYLDSSFNDLKSQKFEQALISIELIENEEHREAMSKLVHLIQFEELPDTVAISPISDKDLIFIQLLIDGYYETYKEEQSNLEAFKKFSEALNLAKSENKKYQIKASLIAILDLFAKEIFIGSTQYETYLEEFEDSQEDSVDNVLMLLYQITFNSKANGDLGVEENYLIQVDKLEDAFSGIENDHPLFARYYLEKALQAKMKEDLASSLNYLFRSNNLILEGSYSKSLSCTVIWQIAYAYFQDDQIDKSLEYLNQSRACSQKLKATFFDDRLQAIILNQQQKFDSAYFYLNKSIETEYKLGYKNNTLESSIFSERYGTEKLKTEKLLLDIKQKRFQNIAIALGSFLLLGSIIAVLVYRNTKRKQHIAEQAKELEIQRTEKILKEKEIETINAMVSGQEKERQRLAGELHDNLGSTLATVRMQVENLERNLEKVDNPKALLTKTHRLINEAYEKVRTISHERNAGVLAKDGLLPAIQRLANTISSEDGLSIEVEDFGLEQRLSNDLEITIFRIVQELVTNIVKHAKATEATISLTQHEGELNILVEDNGRGFKVGTLQNKNGMGLGSIERRVEHLEGSMSVDSTLGRGTHIIIDIPL